MKRVDATDIRGNFAEIADGVRASGEAVIVQRNGRPLVAIVRVEQAEGHATTSVSKAKQKPFDREEMDRLLTRAWKISVLDDRSADEILGYSDDGLPH